MRVVLQAAEGTTVEIGAAAADLLGFVRNVLETVEVPPAPAGDAPAPTESAAASPVLIPAPNISDRALPFVVEFVEAVAASPAILDLVTQIEEARVGGDDTRAAALFDLLSWEWEAFPAPRRLGFRDLFKKWSTSSYAAPGPELWNDTVCALEYLEGDLPLVLAAAVAKGRVRNGNALRDAMEIVGRRFVVSSANHALFCGNARHIAAPFFMVPVIPFEEMPLLRDIYLSFQKLGHGFRSLPYGSAFIDAARGRVPPVRRLVLLFDMASLPSQLSTAAMLKCLPIDRPEFEQLVVVVKPLNVNPNEALPYVSIAAAREIVGDIVGWLPERAASSGARPELVLASGAFIDSHGSASARVAETAARVFGAPDYHSSAGWGQIYIDGLAEEIDAIEEVVGDAPPQLRVIRETFFAPRDGRHGRSEVVYAPSGRPGAHGNLMNWGVYPLLSTRSTILPGSPPPQEK